MITAIVNKYILTEKAKRDFMGVVPEMEALVGKRVVVDSSFIDKGVVYFNCGARGSIDSWSYNNAWLFFDIFDTVQKVLTNESNS